MRIEDEIKQDRFPNALSKAILNILLTADRISSATNATLKPFGISKEQYNVLRILRGQYPKPSALQLISERMISQSSNATRLVEKLRTRGLAERSLCAANRRKVDILVTQKGMDLLDAIAPHLKAGGRWEGNITEEEAQELNRMLDKLRG